MTTFTKEHLQHIIETDHVQCGDASALARIALESLEAEPVGWFVKRKYMHSHPAFKGQHNAFPLYTAQPAPVVPDEKWLNPDIHYEEENGLAEGWNESRQYAIANRAVPPIVKGISDYCRGWNACRAAMLHFEPVNQPSSNQPSADAVVGCEIKQPSTNEHVTQIKPVADLYEVTVPSGRSTTFTTDAAEAKDWAGMGWKVQEYVKLERYQSAMLQGKAEQPQNAQQNIPENIPDGYVLVPVEPTEAMMLHKSGCQHHAWDDQDCVMRQTRRLIWSHMIAAAPKQEV